MRGNFKDADDSQSHPTERELKVKLLNYPLTADQYDSQSHPTERELKDTEETKEARATVYGFTVTPHRKGIESDGAERYGKQLSNWSHSHTPPKGN